MNLKDIPEHMKMLGLSALKHANYHSAFYSFENNMWSELSVLQAAHAAEILIKARISQEHPLLIFDQLPTSKKIEQSKNDYDFDNFIKYAKSITYSELPERLWITTGIKIENEKMYKEFGELRNIIQHSCPPNSTDFSLKTLNFIYNVIDPFIHKCWGLYAIEYHEDTEEYFYIVDSLISKEIEFLVPPRLAKEYNFFDFECNSINSSYIELMTKRFNRESDSV